MNKLSLKQHLVLVLAIILGFTGAALFTSYGKANASTDCHWQRYSWTGGPHESNDPPAFPSPDWQPNVQGDPHGIGVEGPYYMSHGNSGNGDWFYLERVCVTTPDPTDTPTPEPTDTPTPEPTDTPTTDRDVCSNLLGVQLTPPRGAVIRGGKCVMPEPEPEPTPPTHHGVGTPTKATGHCVGNTWVVKTTKGTSTTTSYVNGSAKCTTEKTHVVVNEEGM